MKTKKIIIIIFVVLLVSGGVFVVLDYFNNSTGQVVQSQKEEREKEVDSNQQIQNDLKKEEINASLCSEGIYVEEFFSCGKEVGLSVEGRPIYVFRVGEGENKVLVVGGLHTGTEKNTFDLAKSVLHYYNDKPELVPENVSLYIIPVVNPDGIVNNTHNNVNGVDLNRNWPTENWQTDTYHPTYGTKEGAGGERPLSESETESLYNFITSLQPDMTFVWHSQAGTVEDNNVGDSDRLAGIYAQAADYEHIEEWTYYVVTGDFLAAMGEIDIAVAEVELMGREQEFDRNIEGVKAVLNSFKN